MDGWTLSTMTATQSAGNVTRLVAGSAGIISCLLPGSGAQSNYRIDESKDIRVKMRVRLEDLLDRKGFGFCVTAANIHTAQTDTTSGEIRFIWVAGVLYAQNANGTATSTDISSGITGTNWNTYEIVFNPGTDIKYYINGTLKATHTTNLPTTGTLLLAYGVNTNGRAIWTTFPVVSIQD
jgi:hypothetical protein